MTDAYTLALAMQQAIVANAAVRQFCIDRYGTAPSVFMGMDEQDPPGEDKYPVVAFMEFRSLGGGTDGYVNCEFSFGCGVKNETVDYDAGNKTYFYKGFVESEQLRALVFSALTKANLGKISARGEAGQASNYPLFVAGQTVEVKTINVRSRE